MVVAHALSEKDLPKVRGIAAVIRLPTADFEPLPSLPGSIRSTACRIESAFTMKLPSSPSKPKGPISPLRDAQAYIPGIEQQLDSYPCHSYSVCTPLVILPLRDLAGTNQDYPDAKSRDLL